MGYAIRDAHLGLQLRWSSCGCPRPSSGTYPTHLLPRHTSFIMTVIIDYAPTSFSLFLSCALPNLLPLYTDLCIVFCVSSSFVFFSSSFSRFSYWYILALYPLPKLARWITLWGKNEECCRVWWGCLERSVANFQKGSSCLSFAPHSNLSLSCLFFIFSRTPFGMLPACFTYWTRVECRRDNDLDFWRWPLTNYRFCVLYAA